MKLTQPGLQGSQAWGKIGLSITRKEKKGIVYFKAPLFCSASSCTGDETQLFPPESYL